MKEVRKSDYTFRTEDTHTFMCNTCIGQALQYYGGCEGILIHWTPKYHRRLHSEEVKVVL